MFPIKESTEEELHRLRKENRILKQERDILKKATVYYPKKIKQLFLKFNSQKSKIKQ